MAFIPAATDLQPSEKMAHVSTVAAAVPACRQNKGRLSKIILTRFEDFHSFFIIHNACLADFLHSMK
jgi:hypothetical protein